MKNDKQTDTSCLPRERFLQFGPESMTESELLAVILRTGTVDANAVQVASQVLALAESPRDGLLGLYDVSLEQLMSVKGIGEVKAIQLKCLAELSMRISRASARKGLQIHDARTVAQYFMEKLRHRPTECVILLCLDSKGQILAETQMSTGSVRMSLVSPREIFLEALRWKAVNILLVHNHPSGDPTPSSSDVELTGALREMGFKLEIPLLDHIVIGDNRYTSLKESGYL